MSDVFVSYKAEDRARVAPLVEALRSDGFSVWWDAQIAAGSEWRQDIQQELDRAKCVVVVWSRRSAGPEGRFVRDEANRAQRRGTYLPIRIDNVEPPLGFGELHALNLKGWNGSPTVAAMPPSGTRFRPSSPVGRHEHRKRRGRSPGVPRSRASGPLPRSPAA